MTTATSTQCARAASCVYDDGHPGDCQPWRADWLSPAEVWQRARDRETVEADHAVEVDLVRHELLVTLNRIRQDRRTADRLVARLANDLADVEVEGHTGSSLVNALGMVDAGVCAALFLVPAPDRQVSTA